MRLSPSDLPALVDSVLGTSGWRTVDQSLIDAFAEVTGDHQWIHVDPERAATGPFGATIAHGFLLLSLMPVLAAEVLEFDVPTRINYGLGKARFPAPTPSGSRVRNRVTLAAVEERPGGLLVTTTHELELEGGSRPALVADYLVLLPTS